MCCRDRQAIPDPACLGRSARFAGRGPGPIPIPNRCARGVPRWPWTPPARRSRRSHAFGFTLIELLISVTIVAVLASVAYPAYRSQVVRAHRTEMQADLMRLAQFMERLHTETGCYNPGADNECTAGTGSPPAIATKSEHYRVEFVGEVDAHRFRLRAIPVPEGQQADDGILELDHLGRRFWDENADGDVDDPQESNWKRG
ncbi:MAG: type IV pilin protein [Thiohalocapsa sp.]|nr:type IV pilin protein [Thiohalocapsa sp.]MCF7990679.1 type IV pilin protein [Thiohalocapsa sp.]